MAGLNIGQEIALAVTTMLAAFLSILGSSLIVWIILKQRKEKSSSYQRLVLGIGTTHLIFAIGWFMAPLAAPRDSSQSVLSIGNTASCTSQAVLVQIGIGCIVYNACLSVHFMMTIRKKWSKERTVQHEVIMHSVALGWVLASAIPPLVMQMYNESEVGSGCSIQKFPLNCDSDQNPVPCTRGETNIFVQKVMYALTLLPFALSTIIVVICNRMVYLTVNRSEEKANRHSFKGCEITSRLHERTKATAAQATWYVVLFVNFHFWEFLLRVLDISDVVTDENESAFFALIMVAQFFSAASGFGFLVVYLRPSYLRCRKRRCKPLQAILIAMAFKKMPLSVNRRLNSRHSESSIPDELESQCSRTSRESAC